MRVQYELYIDVFFMVNLMMDFLMLLLVRKVLKCTATHGRAFLGAVSGSFLTCVIVCIPIPAFIKIICCYTLVNTVMLLVGIKVDGIREFAKAWVWLYLVGILLGGILTWLYPYIGMHFRIGCFFFASTAAVYFLVSAILSFLDQFWKLREIKRKVTIYKGHNMLTVNAIIDSGNSLKDELTGKPVHVIGRETAKKLMREEMPSVRYIPYQTIQKNVGVMPVITVDRICIHGNPNREITAPLLGISEQPDFAEGAYEMIIQPESC